MKRDDDTDDGTSGETVEEAGDSFLFAAVTHGLLSADRADQVKAYAKEHRLADVDAVLALSLMEPTKVEAAQLLSRPLEFVPGYELVELIGWGASGNVFKANQLALQRPVALKTIKSQAPSTFESRMQREAEAIARLNHPNIVVPYESGFAKGRFYITMELIEGETLFDFIVRNSPVNEVVTWQIIRQAAAALSHANDAGIIHRDIKPANVLLATAPAGSKLPRAVPFVKVVDFGLARDFKGVEAARITVTGMALGTPAYVAPEQLDDTAVDCRADIFSLGATAFHLLSGIMPYANQSPMKTLVDKSLGKNDWREQLPPSVSAISTKLFRDMTETDPDGRVANYDELIVRIDALLTAGGETLGAEDVAPISHGREESRRSKASWRRMLATIAILLVVGGGLAWHSGLFDAGQPIVGRIDPSTVNVQGNWQPSGPPEPLFNGRSVPFRLVKGNWIPESAGDGSLVLRGQERSSLHLPLSSSKSMTKNARLRLNVALLSDTGAADVSFDITDESQSVEDHAVGKVRITAKEALVFDPSDQSVAPLGQPVHLSSPASDSETPFRRLQIDRLDDVLIVLANGQMVGRWRVEPTFDVATVVGCTSGDVQVADIDVVELVDLSESTEVAP